MPTKRRSEATLIMSRLTEEMRNEVEQMIRAERGPDGEQLPFAPRRRVDEELVELKAKIIAVEDQIRAYEEKIERLTAASEARSEGRKSAAVGEFVFKKKHDAVQPQGWQWIPSMEGDLQSMD